jgi:hypothetical protein
MTLCVYLDFDHFCAWIFLNFSAYMLFSCQDSITRIDSKLWLDVATEVVLSRKIHALDQFLTSSFQQLLVLSTLGSLRIL